MSEPDLLQTEESLWVPEGLEEPSPAAGLRLCDLPLSRRLIAFGFLLIAEFFYGWAWNTVDVLRPFFRQSLGLSLTQAGSAYSAQGAGALIGAIVFGQLADRFGRRNMLVVVMIGYGLLLVTGVTVSSYVTLLLQRFALGLFLGGSFPVVVGIYVELFKPTLRGKLASAINTTFSSAIIVLGMAFGHLGRHDWHLLLWIGGVPPVLLSGLTFVVVPELKHSSVAKAHITKIPIAELFTPGLRRRTLLLASLTGLNFFSYQAFSGWLTTYLQGTLLLPLPKIGHLISAQFAGNIVGGFFWGWAGDRFGRRFGAIGFFLTAAAIGTFLSIPPVFSLLLSLGFAYGFALSASVTWGPWLAELFPPHLKSTASSIFNWGRLVSFFAPLITGALAMHFGLRASMLVSILTFVCAAFIWLALPETLQPLAEPIDRSL
ncbi:MAG: MFS transporter [Janthinobacterium lividum]